MLILKAVILGAVQGISEFFPISSSGHLSLLGNLLGVEIDLTFNILLHLGTLLAVLLNFRGEFIRCIRAFWGILKDLYYNFRQFTDYRGAPEGPVYRRILSDVWRKIVCLLLLSMVPTVLLAAVICPLTEMLNRNLLCSGLGLLVTALVLLVASMAERKQKGPKEARAADAVRIGFLQGIAAFPGVSRFGMALSGGFFSGFSAKFNRIYACLLLIPTIAGAMILEGARQHWSGSTMGLFPSFCGMLSAFAVGFLTIRIALRILSSVSFKGFSGYCACVGVISIVFYLF